MALNTHKSSMRTGLGQIVDVVAIKAYDAGPIDYISVRAEKPA